MRTGTGDFYEDLAFRFTGPVQLARDGRLGDRLIKTDYNNFAPRLGIAYSPSAKWSFRTGFGVFFSQESKNSIFDMSRAAGGRANPVIDQQGVPTLTFQNFINTSQLPVSFAPGLTWGADYNLPTTYTMQYLFNVQRTLGTNSTLEVGYTGNQSRKVAYLVNANAPVPGITPFDAREPYPEWHGIQYLVGDGIGNYNALSGKLTQRFGSRSDGDVQLHMVEGAGREQRDPRNRFGLHPRESALPVLRLRTRRLQHSSPLRHVGAVCAAVRKGQAIPEPRRRAEPDRRRLAAEHNHDRPERHVHQSRIVGFGRNGRRVPALEPPALRRRRQSGRGESHSRSLFCARSFQNTVAGEFGNCGRNSLIAPSPGTWMPPR